MIPRNREVEGRGGRGEARIPAPPPPCGPVGREGDPRFALPCPLTALARAESNNVNTRPISPTPGDEQQSGQLVIERARPQRKPRGGFVWPFAAWPDRQRTLQSHSVPPVVSTVLYNTTGGREGGTDAAVEPGGTIGRSDQGQHMPHTCSILQSRSSRVRSGGFLAKKSRF